MNDSKHINIEVSESVTYKETETKATPAAPIYNPDDYMSDYYLCEGMYCYEQKCYFCKNWFGRGCGTHDNLCNYEPL